MRIATWNVNSLLFRRFEQPPKSYTWWDYRMLAFRRNQGLRIDLLLADRAFAQVCTASSSTASRAAPSAPPITLRSSPTSTPGPEATVSPFGDTR